MLFVHEIAQTSAEPRNRRARLPDNTLEAVLKPLDGLSLGDTVAGADSGLAAAALGDTLTGTSPAIAVSRCSIDQV